MSGHYYFVEKLKIVVKQPYKLNYYGKVSHTLKVLDLEIRTEFEILLSYATAPMETRPRLRLLFYHFGERENKSRVK